MYMQFYGTFSCIHTSSLIDGRICLKSSWHRSACLYGCKKKYHKTACTNVPEDEELGGRNSNCDIDSGTWQQYSGGTQQQLPKGNKITSSAVMDKMCTLLTFERPLLQHGLPYSYLMTALPFVCISIHRHHNEQQDGKIIPVFVHLQTCLVLYNLPSSTNVSAAVWKVLLL